jgi:hypothetical protein
MSTPMPVIAAYKIAVDSVLLEKLNSSALRVPKLGNGIILTLNVKNKP